MRDLQLTPENLLPTITPEDQEFAEKIVKEFDLPMDEISFLIIDVRNDIKNRSEHIVVKPAFKNIEDKLLMSPEVRINELEVVTSDGTIKITESDPLFHYLNAHILKKREKLRKTILAETKRINSLKIRNEYPYYKIMKYFLETSLIPFQRRIAEGLFLIHFGLYGNKPILSEVEFKTIETEFGAYDWKHYITDIMKRREIRFLKLFHI